MGNSKGLTRRAFLGRTAGALAAPCVITSFSLAGEDRPAPSKRTTIGMIGVGGEGSKNLGAFLSQPDAEVRAVCEVDPVLLAQAKGAVENRYAAARRSGTFKGCDSTQDFREFLARDDLDAVAISTPDHWHCLMSLMAVRAGKDVICEKPTFSVQEGRFVADAVKRYGAVFQTSTEDRSLAVYHRMAELVRNGRIGKLERIYVGLPAGPGDAGDPTPQPVPEGFNYELWLGPAPWAPYCKARCHWNFRWVSDYSGGMLTDWGAHLLDTAQWANDTERSGPVEVEGTGKRHTTGLYNTFYDFHLRYKYASGVEMFVDSGNVSLKFEGTQGWIKNNGWIGPLEASSPAILKTVIGPGEIHLFTCPGGEHRNFLDCVKTRSEPYFPAEIGHRCASVMHIGNIAMWAERKLRWDPAAEHFVDDPGPDRMLQRAMRAPWCM